MACKIKDFGILTPLGDLVELSEVTVKDVPLYYLVSNIGYVNRWAGKLHNNWSVLHHSLLCYLLALEFKYTGNQLRMCLCHDLEEGIIGDIPTPLKDLIKANMPETWEALSKQLDTLVYESVKAASGFELDIETDRQAVKRIDLISRAMEEKFFLCREIEKFDTLDFREGSADYDMMEKLMARLLRMNQCELEFQFMKALNKA